MPLSDPLQGSVHVVPGTELATGTRQVYGGLVTLEEFLALPLVARVAANGPQGPTVRPVWFLYEDSALWWLTASSYSRLGEWLSTDPRVAGTIDTCDLASGQVLAVTMTGNAVVVPFDPERAVRKLTKYLGPDRTSWSERFSSGTFDDHTTRLVTLRPVRPPRLREMFFTPSHTGADGHDRKEQATSRRLQPARSRIIDR